MISRASTCLGASLRCCYSARHGSAARRAQQILKLKIMAPAAPGGGWDQTARSMQQVLDRRPASPAACRCTNVAGAGGAVGIAQFVNSAKGDGNQLMVNGFVMVGALAMNKSPVTLGAGDADCAPHRRDAGHRGAGELADQEREGPRRGDQGRHRQGDMRGRLGRRRRPHHWPALFAGAIGADPSKVNYVAFSGGGESLAAILGAKVHRRYLRLGRV